MHTHGFGTSCGSFLWCIDCGELVGDGLVGGISGGMCSLSWCSSGGSMPILTLLLGKYWVMVVWSGDGDLSWSNVGMNDNIPSIDFMRGQIYWWKNER